MSGQTLSDKQRPTVTTDEARDLTDRIKAGFAEADRLRLLLPPKEKPVTEDRRSVYFIRADNGLIKIGVAADPKDRLHTLSTMSPVGLSLIAVIPDAGAKGESNLHRKFAAHRSHGEWFRPAPELVDYIKGIV